jgi:ribosomal protein S18 acetylase RimI-like enzyme
MDNIVVRFLTASDLPYCLVMDPNYSTDFVWQMEVVQEEKRFDISFREVKLPRSMQVEYPRTSENIIESFVKREAVLVGTVGDDPIGFISLHIRVESSVAFATDLVVNRRFRRQGVGSTLVRSAQNWAKENNVNKLQLEMQSKNFPGIELANNLGFEFCGYSDRYYKNQDIALFFMKRF